MSDLFDEVFEGKGPSLVTFNIAQAFIAIALAVVTSDGTFSDDEREALAMGMRRLKVFNYYPIQQLRDALDKVGNLLTSEGVNVLLERAKVALHPDYRETAFYFATDLALADGVLADGERQLLNQIQTELDIDRATAIKIIEVVMIKNRG